MKVLILEDDETYQCLLHDRMQAKGFRVCMARKGAEGLAYFKRDLPDVVIVDLHLPDMPGGKFLERVMEIDPGVIALVITGYASVESSIEAMRMGAEDYLPKPINLEHLDLVIDRGLERRRLRKENEELSFASGKTNCCGELIGSSKAMVDVYKEISRAAKTSDTVLILGETGTGKELAARAIYSLGIRKDRPFLAINCSSISEALLESELFGHVKGAFTGATSDRPGYFEAANGGTLLLDEIQSAPPSVQSALLRVLDRREVVRVGGHEPIPVNVRSVVTCNADLDALISSGTFREDLYYRILERSFTMPPLRDHREDIPMLTKHFCETVELPENVERRRFSPKAMSALMNYRWPGNIRELRNRVTRIAQDAPRPVIRPVDLPGDFNIINDSASSFPPLIEVEMNHVLEALLRSNYNKAEAAKMLGISRSSLYALIRKHEITDIFAHSADQ